LDPTLQALLLDFDGTLVDSEPLHYDCWSQTVRPYGASISWTDYHRRMVGTSDRECGRTLLQEAGHLPTEDLVDLLCAEKKRVYRDRFCQELTLPPEVVELLTGYAKTLPVGIVSSSLTGEVEPFLVQVGLRDSLRFVVCGDHVAQLKPHPDPYLRALELLNQNGFSIRAGHCLVVEDSDSGVASAQAAGMRVERVRSSKELPSALQKHLSALDKS
jgi:HAD superfamily hydrolase (TIGR01509 family)